MIFNLIILSLIITFICFNLVIEIAINMKNKDFIQFAKIWFYIMVLCLCFQIAGSYDILWYITNQP